MTHSVLHECEWQVSAAADVDEDCSESSERCKDHTLEFGVVFVPRQAMFWSAIEDDGREVDDGKHDEDDEWRCDDIEQYEGRSLTWRQTALNLEDSAVERRSSEAAPGWSIGPVGAVRPARSQNQPGAAPELRRSGQSPRLSR